MFSGLFKENDTEEYDSDAEDEQKYSCIIPIPTVSNDRYIKDTRKCIRHNYIPYFTPRKLYPDEWYDSYYLQLENLFSIFKNIINNRYQKNKIEWDSEFIKMNFAKLIYHCSSKHIDRYIS
jgi:hypothetical protein|tara:strand:+ start:912 stop:1274 length:363 start_codon:yes stop_codon:yes gene_type:complete